MKREPRRPWAGDFTRRRSHRHKKPSSRLGNLPINVARECRGTDEGGKSSFAPTAIVGVRTFSRALLGVKNRAWRRRVFCGSPVHKPPETGGGLETLSIKNPQKSFTPSLNPADRRYAGVSGDRRGGQREKSCFNFPLRRREDPLWRNSDFGTPMGPISANSGSIGLDHRILDVGDPRSRRRCSSARRWTGLATDRRTRGHAHFSGGPPTVKPPALPADHDPPPSPPVTL